MSEDMIVRNPEILGGTPCIRGTRLNVYAIEGRFKGGETAEELLEGYTDLTADAVHAAVAYAEKHPLKEHPDARPWRKAAARRDVA